MNVRLIVDDRLEWPMRIYREDDIVIVTRSTHLAVAEALMAAIATSLEES